MPKLLLRGGHLLTMDDALGELPRADVLIDGDRIVAVGPGLDPADAAVQDVRGHVVLPGLVDSHRHLWQSALAGIGADLSLSAYLPLLLGTVASRMEPADLRLSALLGAAEALHSGVTTVFDYCNATRSDEHADASVAGLAESGARAVYGHGDPERHAGLADLAARAGLVTGAVAMLSNEHAPMEQTGRHLAVARELGLVASMHVGCGAHGGRAGAVAALHRAGLLGPDLHFVHGNTITDAEVGLLVDSGAGVTVTPGVEAMMGHGPSAYGRFAARGARPAVGLDVAVTAGHSLFDQLRATLVLERDRHHRAALDVGREPTTLAPAAGDLLHAATVDGAAAIGLADRTGSLTPGKQADVVLLRGLEHLVGRPEPGRLAGAVVAMAGPADVTDVLVAGRFVKRHGRLVDHDLAALRAAGADLATRVLR
ncbi:amidohydrolase family protein [Micromonospora sp. L31]|uniref:amidohydrolase family protein n=1 Tax=Micromonospora sp. L31 TaxID=3452213 RepID=UPI003F8AA383